MQSDTASGREQEAFPTFATERYGITAMWPRWVDYVIVVVVETALTYLLWEVRLFFPLPEFPIPYILVTIGVAYLFGLGPAIVAFVVGFVPYLYLFSTPPMQWLPASTREWARVIAFIIGNLLGALGALLIRANQIRIQRLAGEVSLARDAAEQSRATLETILETAPTGIVVAEADTGKITYSNSGAINILGAPATGTAEAPSPGDFELSKSDQTPLRVHEMPLVRSLRTGERVANFEILIRRKDGSRTVALVNSAPVRDHRGDITAAVANLIDITELVNLRHVLQRHVTLLQRALTPKVTMNVEGYDIGVEYVAATTGVDIGGDFYDVFPAKDGCVGVLIGDVSGKGVRAAAMAVTARNTIRAFSYETSSSAEVLARTNAVLYSQQPSFGSFVTIFLMILHPQSGRIVFTSAGHPPAVLYHPDGEAKYLSSGQPPTGISEDVKYKQMWVGLEPGSKIVMYTDGISESRRNGQMFESEGVEQAIRKCINCNPRELAAHILADATDWAEGKLNDDAAVMVIERKSKSA